MLQVLRTDPHRDWARAPSHGIVHVRLPCPTCGGAEKRAERTRLDIHDSGGAVFTAVCTDHGERGQCPQVLIVSQLDVHDTAG